MFSGGKKEIIGALHLPRCGLWDPGMSMAKLQEYVLTNCRVFYENGVENIYIQDENLAAPGPCGPEMIAIMTALAQNIKTEFPKIKLGVIVEAHDGIAPIAIAHAAQADFVRIKVFSGVMVKRTGLQEGCGVDAVQYRRSLGAEKIKILADAHDRTGFPLIDMPIERVAAWADFTGADGVVLTGRNFDESMQFIKTCKESGIQKPLILGGGANQDNIRQVLALADGVIVSTALKLSRPIQGSLLGWDAEKIRAFMDAAFS